MYVDGDVRHLLDGLDIFGSFVNLDHAVVVRMRPENVVDIVIIRKMRLGTPTTQRTASLPFYHPSLSRITGALENSFIAVAIEFNCA